MYPADRAVLGKPALTRRVDRPAALWALRPSYPLEDDLTKAVTEQISGTGRFHLPIFPRSRT